MNLEMLLHFTFLLWLTTMASSVYAAPSIALPGCEPKCGDVDIPFPFGIGENCSHSKYYQVSCDKSHSPHKPFLHIFNLQVLNVSLHDQTSIAIIPVHSNCDSTAKWNSSNLAATPYTYSPDNSFMVVGCDNALLLSQNETVSGCTSVCRNVSHTEKGCYGINCCQTSLTYPLTSYSTSFAMKQLHLFTSFLDLSCNFCRKVFPILQRHPDETDSSTIRLESIHDDYSCYNTRVGDDVPSYYCQCEWTRIGNPYISNGCTGSTLGGVVFILALFGFSFWLCKELKRRKGIKLREKFFKRNGGLLLQQQLSSDNGYLETTKVFAFQELQTTSMYPEFSDKEGRETVYKGMLTDGKIVAVN